MVKKLFKFFAYFAFFILALIYFTPKKSIYYISEGELEKYSVIVSDENLYDNGFSLNIQNANISVKAINSANIKETNIKIFGIYNSIDINEIKLSNTAKSFIPLNIKNVNIKYSIIDPLNIKGFVIGEFGEANLNLNLLKLFLHIDVKPSKVMIRNYKSTLRNLKKSKNGEYIYEQNI